MGLGASGGGAGDRGRGGLSSDSAPELSVVLPVYNEGEVIERVLAGWSARLDDLGIDYELAAYDDGSRDQTLEVLRRAAEDDPRLLAHSHPNRGHGPTLLRGYREARGDWVFQTDSDDEIPPEPFEELWSRRSEHDFLIGARSDRRAPLARRIITWSARRTVHLLFGRGIDDLNCPFRLIRRYWLQEQAIELPEDTFAPNVILSGLAIRQGLRIYEHSVPYRPRATGSVSIGSWRLWWAAMKSFHQTVRAAGTMRRLP